MQSLHDVGVASFRLFEGNSQFANTTLTDFEKAPIITNREKSMGGKIRRLRVEDIKVKNVR